MSRYLAAILGTVFLASTSLMAGTVKVKQVSGAAKWVVHFDAAGFVASGLGKFLIEKGKDHDLAAKAAKFADKFGFDPLTDLQGVTLYGENFEPTGGVAIIQVKVDKDKLLKLLAANKGHKELKYGDRVVHQWTQAAMGRQPAGDRFGVFYGNDLVVITQSQDVLKYAVDVLDGKAVSMAKAATEWLSKVPKGTYFTAAAVDIVPPKNAKIKGIMLQSVSSGCVAVGENDKTLFAKVQVTAKTEEDATRISQMVGGFLAMASLAAERATDKGMPDASALLKGIKVTAERQSVMLEATASLKDVEDFIDAAAKARQTIREAKAKAAGKSYFTPMMAWSVTGNPKHQASNHK